VPPPDRFEIPSRQTSLRFFERTTYVEDYDGLAVDDVEGTRLASEVTGPGVIVLRNHGVVVLGNGLAEAVEDLYYFERACDLQLRAASTGQELAVVSDTVARKTARQFQKVRPEGARAFMASLVRRRASEAKQ
jgi:ribulose-5-phosphate 4-epimerase/fuculose-1-phosphate aldolase